MRGLEKGKMAQICMFNSKWPTSSGRGAMKSIGYFVRLGMTNAVSHLGS